MATIQQVIDYLHQVAPPGLQESYDNAGLITGDASAAVTGVLVSLDCLEEVVDEAIAKKCNLIVSHHPIVFKGLKSLTGRNYVERVVLKAIKNEVALFAIHTNLDNVAHGVNAKIGEAIGLINGQILSPKPGTLKKLTTFVPENEVEKVAEALHRAGGGQIGNYKDCSFRVEGMGTFLPTASANPYSGEKNIKSYEKEVRLEMIFPFYAEKNLIRALKNSHPYEEVAYYINALDNENQEVGAGIIGELPEAMAPMDFFQHLVVKMGLPLIKHTKIVKNAIKKVAICGGSGSFLTARAIGAGADVYVSADYKYHEFFDAEGKIIIADIGHYESEKFTNQLLFDLISNNFPTFAVHLTGVNTNPVLYYK